MTGPHPAVAWKPFTESAGVASVRVRCLEPHRLLAEAGWRSELLDPRRPRAADVVVFTKAYTDADRDLAESLRRRGTRVVLDLCDHHLWVPDGDVVLAARAERLRRMLEVADAVTVSTPALAEAVGHPHTYVVPDALDPVASEPTRPVAWPRWRHDTAEVVWFGNAGSASPPFGLVDLAAVVPELEALAAQRPFRLTVITSSRAAYREHLAGARFRHRFVRWRRRTFASVLAGADVTILPVTLNPFTACKTANRALTSLLVGVPVVAGRTAPYEELVPFVLLEDWAENVTRYVTDPDLAYRHVVQGRAHARAVFGDEAVRARWSAVLTEVAALPV